MVDEEKVVESSLNTLLFFPFGLLSFTFIRRRWSLLRRESL
jgi:hypothetical protein